MCPRYCNTYISCAPYLCARTFRKLGAAQYISDWHLEDNLVRAALFRWLRTQGRGSQLRRFASVIKRLLELKGGPGVAGMLAPLLEEPHVAHALDKAADIVVRHLPSHPQNNLLRVAYLWIVGRRGQPSRVAKAIQEMGHWLQHHPEETLVRTSWIWLAGFRGASEQAEVVIDSVGAWLNEPRQEGECVARSAWLWLVGQRGTAAQVESAIPRTARWLEAHTTDTLIRVANLLFLVKRRGDTKQIHAALEAMRSWLARHEEEGLVRLATDYVVRRTNGGGERGGPKPQEL